MIREKGIGNTGTFFYFRPFRKWPLQESNLDLEFRKLLFYPLNYETDWERTLHAFSQVSKLLCDGGIQSIRLRTVKPDLLRMQLIALTDGDAVHARAELQAIFPTGGIQIDLPIEDQSSSE